MPSERLIPNNPLDFIKRCVKEQRIFWTYHVNMRMKGRFIPRKIVLDSIQHYEIIEEYPGDKYLPSYLVFSKYQDKIFHVLFAVDVEADNVRVITAYYPSLDEWEEDFKNRRK
ncbi:MAG: DUF4258 domain-containing protein [Deltaproteobacteria bacterium]|nr:DUF4258 domain-containing protein [Deltaproteobacteria bacterium]